MRKATLSVVMPNYNHARYLPVALEAVLRSHRAPDQIVVVDDASTDRSRDLIDYYAQRDPRIVPLFNATNIGVVASMNRGLAAATGDYVALLAADDWVMPELFDWSLQLLERWPTAAYCSTLSHKADSAGRDLGLFPSWSPLQRPGYLPPERAIRQLALHGTWVLGNTTVYRTSALKGVGGFDPGLAAYCDGFLHELLAIRDGACFIPRPLAVWRVSADGYSATTSTDTVRWLAVLERAETLMRTRYADVFPEWYVRTWQRRQRSGAAWQAWRRHQDSLEQELRQLLSPPSRQDDLLLNALGVAAKLLRRLVMVYVRIALTRPFRNPARGSVDPR